MNRSINILCLKWGNKYSATYVNRLYHMVCRNLRVPFVFHCLTEDPSGLDPDISHLPLATREGMSGWWYKLSLFQKDFYGLTGEIVYLDLDLVIVGNIDFLVELPGDFMVIKNWSRRLMWNSSVMRFPVGKYSFIWEKFIENTERIVSEYNGDQEWIFACVPEAKQWPDNKILSYKKSLHSRAFPWLKKLGLDGLGIKALDFLDTALPPDAAIVVFHGKPDPEDIAEHSYGLWKRASFVKQHWR